MDKLAVLLGSLLILLVRLLLVVIGPLLILWSLNTLFPALAIPYDFWTWFAALFLAAALKAKVTVTKS